MTPEFEASDFYVAGGTLRASAPSYVNRPADEDLFNLAQTGEFCYVLTSRQMGKSSLMVRTVRRLESKGVRSVIIDLTNLGVEVNVEQWYLGLLNQLKRRLRLATDPEQWWRNNAALGHVQRFTTFLHDVVLEEIQEQVVIFIDEIDTTLNLDFSDDFFAAIRFVYNARATDPIYQRLTFVLLGVAIPADLIKDRRRTPFNIGQRIDLSDFSREDARILMPGLEVVYPDQAETIFNRIFYWTNGHPYLTQKLCLSAIEANGEKGQDATSWTDEKVDALVEELFLSQEASRETNLQFVRDFVTNSPQKRELLQLYKKVYTGQTVQENERSLAQNQLKLFGLVRVENKALKVRNEIYRRVFDQAWIKANTPVDKTRQIMIAFAAIVLALVGIIVWQQQQQPADQEQADAYVSTFRSDSSPATRLDSLAGLYTLSDYTGTQPEELFYKELTTEGRMELFQTANPEEAGEALITVIKNLYPDLENSPTDNELLQAMAKSLDLVDDSRASNLTIEIKQWLQGRELFTAGDHNEAAATYTSVINTINDRNPGIFFDRGLAYTEVGESKEALADFEQAINLDESRTARIVSVVNNNPDLYTTLNNNRTAYPNLGSLVATPTSTATPTATSTPTATPTRTPSPTPTSKLPTPTPEIIVVTPTPVPPTSTPTNTPTLTPVPSATPTSTSTPTPVPQPATVVYVQSNFDTHTLGLVTSGGQILTEGLHPRAAAPAWSPDGTKVAFYGEEGISELGGDYAQGSGIWIIDVASGNTNLLFQIVHVNNINWSPDSQKIALEVEPPGESRRVMIIDAAGGKELSRFPGEQPAWNPNSQELAIKSCQPDCGLWRVGFDGSGGTLLTQDSTDSYPTWSSDNKYLVFSSRRRHGDWEIYRLTLETPDEIIRLTERPGTDTTPVFSPDGLEIYLRTDAFGLWRIMAMSVDGANERLIKENIGPSNNWGLARPAVN